MGLNKLVRYSGISLLLDWKLKSKKITVRNECEIWKIHKIFIGTQFCCKIIAEASVFLLLLLVVNYIVNNSSFQENWKGFYAFIAVLAVT